MSGAAAISSSLVSYRTDRGPRSARSRRCAAASAMIAVTAASSTSLDHDLGAIAVPCDGPIVHHLGRGRRQDEAASDRAAASKGNAIGALRQAVLTAISGGW